MKYLESAKNAIQEGASERAISLLREYISKAKRSEFDKISEDLILLGSRFNILQSSKNRELIGFDEQVQELNKINLALLAIICELEEKCPDSNGIFGKALLMNMPKNAIADSLYYGFLIFGCIVGLGFLYVFFYIFYHYIKEQSSSIKELLFIGSTGVLASCFLTGAYEGINRKKGMLVNWKIVGPHIIVAVAMLIGAAILSII